MKYIVILSSKSSGSTALQNYLKNNFGYKTINATIHKEEETLYWTKVATVLKRPQEKMYRSSVPYSIEDSIEQLNWFFRNNGLPNISCNEATTEKQFQEFYFKLLEKMGSKVVEKSPHHLYNASNLELIKNFYDRYKHRIEFVILGLVRHPQAVMMSGWNRWGYQPKYFQSEWIRSYENLLDFQQILNINIIKYENLINGSVDLEKIINEKLISQSFVFKKSSLNKWENNPLYGFRLSDEGITVAKKYDYNSFNTKSSLKWYWLSAKSSLVYSFKNGIKYIIHSKPKNP